MGFNPLGGISDFLSGGAYGDAADAAQQGVDEMRRVKTPDVDQMILQLQEMVSQGQLTMEEAEAILQKESAVNDIKTNPVFDDAQMKALESLQELGEGGMTAMDRANLAQIKSQEASAERGSREAILSNARARGVGGSGLEQAAQLEAQQGAATRGAARDTQVAGQVQQRALDALQGAGALGGRMQESQFNQGFAKARANDAINQFNTSTLNATNLFNVKNRNDASTRNLDEKQRIADANTDMRNKQQQYNKQLAQQKFDNEIRRAGGVAGAYGNQADQFRAEGDATTNLIGSGIQAGGLWASKSDENAKTDIEEIDMEDLMDSLTATKYRYKNPKDGKGPQIGVMAQDVEKKAPGLVFKGPDGDKMIDNGKSVGPLFAGLADLNKRLKKVEGK